MSMIPASILRPSLIAWFLAGIATVIISQTFKVQIKWATLYFFAICSRQVAWAFWTARSKGCLGFSIEIKIAGFGVGRRLYSVLFSTTQ